MREIFCKELRNRVQEIRIIEKMGKTDGAYQISEKGKMLLDTIYIIEELSEISRKHGLLELEKRVCEIYSIPGERYLKQLIYYVVCGSDPELLMELAELRYYSASFSDYNALQYLIMVKGVIEIQKGTNPIVIRELLFSMLPEEFCDPEIIKP